MRKTLLCLFVISVCVGIFSSCRKNVLPVNGGGDPPPHDGPLPEQKLEETQPPVLSPVTYNISTNIHGYYKALPARYFESNEKYPVIIWLHGGGQYGNGNSDLPIELQEGIPKLINEKKFPASFTVNDEKFSFIVIAPQLVKKIFNPEMETLVTYVKNTFRVDPSRIYLAGMSLGGRMCSEYAAYKPNEIAALVAMAGLPPIDEELTGKCSAMSEAQLPVWQFHNKDDSAWYYSEASRYIEVFNGLNPVIPPKFTTFEVGEARLHHDCWTRTTDPNYREDDKNIYEWMLQYSR
ncbi:MAG TPA: PHB depolymerase family esterase [Flavitalea sp.]|nr:PHB depolymerase family esterase [Flavitalea sp.]